MDFVAPPSGKGATVHAYQSDPTCGGARTFGGERGRELGNSPFSRLLGLKPWSSNWEMLPGFLLLKLPVATMVNGSVSLAGRNGFQRRWKKQATRTDLQEQARRAEAPKVLRVPEAN